VKKCMVGVSSATITCLSILELKYVELLHCLQPSHYLPKDTNAMMLVSRLDFETDPFTMIFEHSSVHVVCNNFKYPMIYSTATMYWLMFYVHLCQICGKKGE
jgi:hypothetical protein